MASLSKRLLLLSATTSPGYLSGLACVEQPGASTGAPRSLLVTVLDLRAHAFMVWDENNNLL